MNYADIKRVDVANGEGVRVSVFVSGCNHHCKGCFNQCAWDFNYGNKFTDEQIDTVLKSRQFIRWFGGFVILVELRIYKLHF